MTNKHMRNYLTLLVIGKMQTKLTMKYYFTLGGYNKENNNNKWSGGWETAEAICTARENVKWCSHFEKQFGSFAKS